MAAKPATGAGEMPCPDPTLHGITPSKLQDQASKAALLAAGNEKGSGATSSQGSHNDFDVLGPDGRLSSAGAATSLKHAKAQDLPSFPSVGIDTTTSGNKAANLAAANQKPFEHWKPELSSSASKAATLAAKDGGKVNLWHPEASETGLGAAGLAMSGKSLSPQLDYGYTDNGKRNSLLAATKSISGSTRARPESTTPTSNLYPDQENSAYNALNAATVAGSKTAGEHGESHPHKFPVGSLDAARVSNTQNVPREMYTEHPPVAIEVEEKKRNDALRASAVSMAKQMYDVQQRQSTAASHDAGGIAARKVATEAQQAPTSQQDMKEQARQYLNLQDAAQKMAAERLAKLDPDGSRAYREHYGYSDTSPKKRFSFRRSKGRSTSDAGEDSSDDEAQASQIRSQMSSFNTRVAEVDAKKRDDDRKNLLAAAEKSVTARMRAMDEKAFLETGKPTAALQQEWEAKAKVKAAADSEQRMQNYGKVHIGGGKYIDQEELNAIAANRMQPTLDQITETAERQRAREEEIRLDQEERKRQAEVEKQRDKEVKAEIRRTQEEDKARERREQEAERSRIADEKAHERAQARMAKAEEKEAKQARKEAEKSADKEESTPRKSADAVPFTATAVPASEYISKAAGAEGSSEPMEKLEEQVGKIKGSANAADAPNEGIHAPEERTTSPTSPTSPVSPSNVPTRSDSKIKSFLGKFKRSSKEPGKFSSGSASGDHTASGALEAGPSSNAKDDEGLYSEPSVTAPKERSPSPDLSSVSDNGAAGKKKRESDDVDEARDTVDEDLAPPNRSSIARDSFSGSASPSRGSKFQEEL